jgi:hypothetical protein
LLMKSLGMLANKHSRVLDDLNLEGRRNFCSKLSPVKKRMLWDLPLIFSRLCLR